MNPILCVYNSLTSQLAILLTILLDHSSKDVVTLVKVLFLPNQVQKAPFCLAVLTQS